MAKKDRFKQMQQEGGGVIPSFQDMANTVAAVEKQAIAPATEEQKDPLPITPDATVVVVDGIPTKQPDRYMRLPNPSIHVREYNMVSQYCNSFINMTRQDWVELAIIEKLHRDGVMADEEYDARNKEIRSRPTRGQRKNTKLK